MAVNASLAVMRNDGYLWINLEVVFGMCLSYELERMPLRQFIKSVSPPPSPRIAAPRHRFDRA